MLGRMGQDDSDFQASLDYVGDPVSKNKLTKKSERGNTMGTVCLILLFKIHAHTHTHTHPSKPT
jgi:hypothetical protein